MKKLRMDDLRVETFATGSAGGEGTVRAHEAVTDYPCYPQEPDYTEACPPHTSVTCDVSCNGSCYNSCYASCQNTCRTCWQGTCPNATCYPCYPVEPEV